MQKIYTMSKSFSDLGINLQIQQSLTDLKIATPTDIQEKTIPIVLNQKADIVLIYQQFPFFFS